MAVSLFLSDSPPGHGPGLHRHPYAEVFVVQAGELTFTVDGEEIVATAGRIVVVPAGTPHKFLNTGQGAARHIDIHASARMITEWLDEDERGEQGAGSTTVIGLEPARGARASEDMA